jgi:Fuc2NAc and GlcNAc transferase
MIWLCVLLALAVSAAAARVMVWCGPVDRPRTRGMHDAPTPTSGGLAIVLGVAAATIMGLWFGASGDRAIGAALGVAVLHGLLGAVDDVYDLGARFKLVVQTALALVFAALSAPPIAFVVTDTLILGVPAWLAILGIALWLVVVTNAVNFMDGSNGLVAGSIAIVAAGLGLTALNAGAVMIALALIPLAGACLGFLPFNFPRARLFQGDTGALFAGSLIAMLAVIGGAGGGAFPLWCGPIALMPILTDVLLTLIVRAGRRERLFEAHKDHLYQRWLAAHGGSHAKLARWAWAIMGGFTFAAMLAARASATAASLTLVGAAGVAVVGWVLIDRTLKRDPITRSSRRMPGPRS